MNRRQMTDEEAVLHLVQEINERWLSKRYDEIGELLSKHAVIAPPGFDGRIRGREAYVQSYREYDQAATTLEFLSGELEIDIVEDVAIAVCPFFVAYELNGEEFRENGRDLLVLSRSTGEWRVMWRSMQTESAEQGADQSGSQRSNEEDRRHQ